MTSFLNDKLGKTGVCTCEGCSKEKATAGYSEKTPVVTFIKQKSFRRNLVNSKKGRSGLYKKIQVKNGIESV